MICLENILELGAICYGVSYNHFSEIPIKKI